MRGADALAQVLRLEGVEILFAYPNHALIEAAARVGIRPIIARGEKTLINMADGYARATNAHKPSVLVVQNGPGIENAFGAFAQAYSDGIPLLMIPGGGDTHRQGEPPQFDPLPVYRNITKWTGRINYPERIAELTRRAFTQVRNGKPGPVLLELPADVSSGPVDEATFRYTPARGYRSAGDAQDVAVAAGMLLQAKRPVLHVGHGVLWAEAWDELRELAELVRAPVMTTMAAKSAFPENHPLSLGAGGHTLTRAAAMFLVKSDLVFGIGCSFARGGFSSPIPPGKTMVQVMVDGRDLDRDYRVDHAVIGDAKLVLRQLIDEVRSQGGAASSSNGAVAAEISKLKEATLHAWMPRYSSGDAPISPYRVIWELNNVLDKANSIVTHDSGNPRDQTLTTYEALTPRGYIGWGKSTQLGTGLGIAMGAKLAFPDKTCVNIMGDLAFGTVGMEVETAVRERLPIMTVILNNSVMGGYAEHSIPYASEKFGTNRLSGNYARVAEGLGAHAERIERPGDVRAALERGVAATRGGQMVVLEMITREEPIYPVAGDVLREVASEALVPA
jgi:thiamine pyrophosphate-dependent acetolactate synthase large subunit-like protein